MLRASGVTARVFADQVPLLTGALELARQGIGPGGTQRNQSYFGPYVSLSSTVEEAIGELLFDPQTSGGLLVSVSGDKKAALLDAMAAHGVAASVHRGSHERVCGAGGGGLEWKIKRSGTQPSGKRA